MYRDWVAFWTRIWLWPLYMVYRPTQRRSPRRKAPVVRLDEYRKRMSG